MEPSRGRPNGEITGMDPGLYEVALTATEMEPSRWGTNGEVTGMDPGLYEVALAATEMEPSRWGTNREITSMDPAIYDAAFKGDIDKFHGVQDIHRQLTPNKNTILHIHFTAESVSIEFVRFIMSSCPLLVLQANSKGETPLHIAARYGHFAAVKTLIEPSGTIFEDLENGIKAERKGLIRATNLEGDSALHEAVRYNHIEVVKFLTEKDPDHSYSANKTGETPLYIAVERGYEDAALKILEKCEEPAYQGPDGRTALHAAVIREDPGTIDVLASKFVIQSFSINM